MKFLTQPKKLSRTIAVVLAFGTTASLLLPVQAQESDEGEVANLSDVTITDDSLRALSNEPSAASFGFAKPLLETPRTVTFVSEEQLRLFGVSTVEDLTRLVPGTYTTTRYGLQGGVNVRGVSADFYYRGMKRLQMQGHVRTVLSAYDNIEVIKGPPSPLYGMGQIGGYANLDPKSSRAKTGKYMAGMQGYLQGTYGRYDKQEVQFGLGIPFEMAGKTAGAYIVGLLEDSGTYVKTVDAQQRFMQGTMSVDNAVGPFRLETGGQIQNSITSGAYFTRVTQDLIDNGTYIQGRPMAMLDINNDGRVGYVETYLASPVSGSISGSNQSLDQRFTWTRDANGDPLPVSAFTNTITGIPQTMLDYLNGPGAALDCDMANYMRTLPAAATGGASPMTRQMPVGFVLDPCTVGTTTLTADDYRGNGAFEREQNAVQRMFYFDLVYDLDPSFTVKNQFFYDSLSSFKDSWLPYGENQNIRAIENKLTITHAVPGEWLPDWVNMNTLGSVNYRNTHGWIRSSGGDWDYRQDITYTTGAGGSGTGGFYPNTMFWTQLTNNSYATGVPDSRWNDSKYSEVGAGLMLDVDVMDNTNIVAGGRYDRVHASASEFPSFNPNTGNIGTPTQQLIDDYALGLACLEPGGVCPGAWSGAAREASSTDSGFSWSVSISHELPFGGMRPYFTFARSTITLDSSNNMYARSTVAGEKLVGSAELQETGIKGALFDNSMQWTLAAFKQIRTDVSAPNDPSISAFATTTKTTGIEASINFQPTREWFIGASFVYLKARYTEGANNLNIDINTRTLGFSDIVAPNGDVYPAEAFGYGGRLRLVLTDPNNIYNELPGSPEYQAALNTTYNLGHGFGLLANAQYQSKSWATRIQNEVIPSAFVMNIGATWDSERAHLKANIYNLTDKTYFRATNGGNQNMVSVMPDRRYEVSLKLDF